jgi:hypothetical protein
MTDAPARKAMTRRELLMLLCWVTGPRFASAQTVTKVHRLDALA